MAQMAICVPFIRTVIAVVGFTSRQPSVGPQRFWGSGENGYLFSCSWGALVIVFRDLGSPAKK